jgi:hypothetical protein
VPPVDTSVADEGTFDVGDIAPPPPPMEDWQAALDHVEYDPTVVEITRRHLEKFALPTAAQIRFKTPRL